MIVYFADRQLNIVGQASTSLPSGLRIVDDLKTEDVETGVAIFECTIPFDASTRSKVEACTEIGNYILRSHEEENEFYTIIDAEIDTKNREVYIYAEDAGLDLLNEIVGEYAADKAYTIDHYINKFSYDSGFVIGINEAGSLSRKLSWDGEATVTERIASVATQFGDFEISYSFDIDGLAIRNKYINIHKKRGKDNDIQLRLNRDIDRIITKKSGKNIATALECTGGTPENKEDPITLKGYEYDDGDFFVSGKRLYSREALKKWSRYIWANEPNKLEGNAGHIVVPFSYDTTNQQTLCSRAITELKKAREVEVNYEIEFNNLRSSKIGDTVYIVDDAGGLYMSARILLLETSVANKTKKATVGDYLIKSSGISQTVSELAAQFAEKSKALTHVTIIATSAQAAAMAAQQQSTYAQSVAEAAQAEAEQALTDAANAQQKANEATEAASNAQQSAVTAQTAADNAQIAVSNVEKSVASLETTIANAETAANNAQSAANTAQQEANEAAQAAARANADAADAQAAVELAQSAAQTAITKADTAQSTADTAKINATTAQETAAAAKLDAQKAIEDIAALGEELETVSTTMQADYARKTDLTESTASLQSQISQNAAQITSTVSKLATVDETANDAKEQAEAAQTAASVAQEQADQAAVDAQAAQTAANNAATAAQNAQSEADKAKAAASTAQSVADKAEADLEAAIADLATVTSRVGATEAEIAAAQQAVTTAQTAADKAKADASAASQKATEAQSTANTAVTNAANAQTAANNAAEAAATAQQIANEAKGDAATAQTKANEAAQAAATAQSTANIAKTNAQNAQAAAESAAQAAANAQSAADDADAKAAQAASDLAIAKQNLANVTSRVGATEEEIEAAQAAVSTAQAAADKAKADAQAAQATADTAKANAATAQTAANNAKTAADNAQKAAVDAQKTADDAQAAVDALAVRVTTAETRITQTSEQISLLATKVELEEVNNGLVESLHEQHSEILTTCSEIILSALDSYVETGDYTEFKETVEAQLSIMADEIVMNFTSTTEQIVDVDGDLQTKFNQLYKFISFTGEDGITIGSGGNAITLTLDNENGIVFMKNGTAFGSWDGVDFMTGNIVVKVNERAQFGNFAFVPRSDGSLMFLKVGG